MESEPVLCYVEEAFAFFTTQSLENQWGDDWNDAPYEHNAERPYRWHKKIDADAGREPWDIIQIAFESDYERPCYAFMNSPYSVRDINRKRVPWLNPNSWMEGAPAIWAGTTLNEFVRLIVASGGQVWMPLGEVPDAE